MRLELVVIGSELLDGTRADTNVRTLTELLSAVGVDVVRATFVPDDAQAMSEAIERAMVGADVVLTTGGLGATADDRTKQVVARLLGRKLVLDEGVLARVRAHFEERAMPMPEANLSQAMIPEGARPIENRRGTAPGLLLQRGSTIIFALPGVPDEMRGMVEGYVIPFLEGRGVKRLCAERTIRTTGIHESEIAGVIGGLAKRLALTDVRYLPSTTGVDLRVVSRGASGDEAARTADRAAEALAAKLGAFVYARGEQSLEDVVAYLLTMARKTVAVAESCTGGLLGWRLTRVPGSSDYFKGGVIAYSDDLKKKLLGVKAASLKADGAVSRAVALEMAEGARRRAESDYGIGVTGIAGPGGATVAKPVGLVVVAVSFDGGQRTREFHFRGPRDSVRAEAAQAALEMLRRALLAIEE